MSSVVAYLANCTFLPFLECANLSSMAPLTNIGFYVYSTRTSICSEKGTHFVQAEPSHFCTNYGKRIQYLLHFVLLLISFCVANNFILCCYIRNCVATYYNLSFSLKFETLFSSHKKTEQNCFVSLKRFYTKLFSNQQTNSSSEFHQAPASR